MSASTITEAITRLRARLIGGISHISQDTRELAVDDLDKLQQHIHDSNVVAFTACVQGTSAVMKLIVAELVIEISGAPLTYQAG